LRTRKRGGKERVCSCVPTGKKDEGSKERTETRGKAFSPKEGGGGGEESLLKKEKKKAPGGAGPGGKRQSLHRKKRKNYRPR